MVPKLRGLKLRALNPNPVSETELPIGQRVGKGRSFLLLLTKHPLQQSHGGGLPTKNELGGRKPSSSLFWWAAVGLVCPSPQPRGLYVPTNSYLLIIHYNTTYKKLLIYLYSYNRGTYQTSVSVRENLISEIEKVIENTNYKLI